MSKPEIESEIRAIKQKLFNDEMSNAKRIELTIVLLELYRSMTGV